MGTTKPRARIRSANRLNSATVGGSKEVAAVVMVATDSSGGSQIAAAAVQVAVSMAVLVAEAREKVTLNVIVQTLKVNQPELPKATCGQNTRCAIREGLYSRSAFWVMTVTSSICKASAVCPSTSSEASFSSNAEKKRTCIDTLIASLQLLLADIPILCLL